MNNTADQYAGRALIGLGGNLPFEGLSGPPLLARALGAIKAAGLNVRAVSSAWASPAWPPSDQPDYVNAAAALEIGPMTPGALFDLLAEIEARFGRIRRERWAARPLDLDILDVGGQIGAIDGIHIPHPRLHERAFVLAPLAEIAPDWRHPVLNASAGEMLAALGPAHSAIRLGPISV